MRKTTRPFLATNEANESGRKTVAMITLTQIIKTHVPIVESSASHAMTYGELLDSQLLMAAHEGRIIQDVSFGFEEEDWNDYANKLRETHPHYVPQADSYEA